MNNSQQAKNGLKTFLITVAVSLVVFTGLYYLVTGSNSEEETIEEQATGQTTQTEQVAANNVQGTADVKEVEVTEPETSVFETLSQEEVEVEEVERKIPEDPKVDESSEESVVNNKKVLGAEDIAETEAVMEAAVTEDTADETTAMVEEVEEPEVLASAETTPIGGVNPRSEVLAESSQSTVPNTGSTEITVALVVASIILTFGGYMISRNPNKVALAEFENRVTKKLD